MILAIIKLSIVVVTLLMFGIITCKFFLLNLILHSCFEFLRTGFLLNINLKECRIDEM